MIRRALGRLMGARDRTSPPLSYAEAKQLARSPDAEARRAVALDPRTRPELLYFLARDVSPGVRAAVASHDATPRQADLLLAIDEVPAIRTLVAEKVTSQIYSLPQDDAAQIWQLTVSILDALARDDLTRVRQLVAETARGLDKFPSDVALKLARDSQAAVAVPALAYPGIFGDDDLVEIVRNAVDPQIVAAVAARPSAGASVVDAAQRRSALLNDAEARQLSGALSISLGDRPDAGAAALGTQLQEHLSQSAAEPSPSFVTELIEPFDDLPARIGRLEAQNALTEDLVIDALGADLPFAIAALALRARITAPVVQKIFRSHSAKGLVSLAWRAGFSMRLGLQLQTRIGHLPPKARLTAGIGSWPLPTDEMLWQIEFFRTLVPDA